MSLGTCFGSWAFVSFGVLAYYLGAWIGLHFLRWIACIGRTSVRGGTSDIFC